jgi:hypothetical protein
MEHVCCLIYQRTSRPASPDVVWYDNMSTKAYCTHHLCSSSKGVSNQMRYARAPLTHYLCSKGFQNSLLANTQLKTSACKTRSLAAATSSLSFRPLCGLLLLQLLGLGRLMILPHAFVDWSSRFV